VCGHYGCGGVLAALRGDRLGLVDNWIRHVRDVHDRHKVQIDGLPAGLRHRRLCELNIVEQVVNVCQSTVARDAWARGQALAVHGWVYALEDGLLRDLNMCITQESELAAQYESACAALTGSGAVTPRPPEERM
jgi:carbonic anhydrase